MTGNRTRVTILGGGVGGLAAAWGLTDPAQNGAFEVTVHQEGWRLGGKAASGRDRANADAIEERGLHVLMGSHDNAFGILKTAYEEQAAQGGAFAPKFAAVWDAMSRENRFTVTEEWKGERVPWVIDLPEMPGLPGDGTEPPLWKVVLEMLEGMGRHHAAVARAAAPGGAEGLLGRAASVGEELLEGVRSALGLGAEGAGEPHWWDRLTASHFHEVVEEVRAGAGSAFHLALGFARGLPEDPREHGHERHVRIADLLDHAWRDLEALWQGDGLESWLDGLELEARRALMTLDLMRTALGGALRDGFLSDPAKAAARNDGIEFRDWLKKHGALEITREGPLVNMVYDLLLAYPDGDNAKRGDLAAGPLVQGLFVLARYRGSFFWKMRGGTGDIIAAPIYRALERRGVKFEFFSRVTDLDPSFMMDRINAVRISRQVRLKSGEYQPLFASGGLECWPSTPDWDQIVEGEELKSRGIDLESFWSGWRDTGGEKVLQIGDDYDVVILAIPPEAARWFCGRLADQKPEWRAMLDGVASCQTQTVQPRFDRPMTALGDPDAVEMVFGGDRTTLYGSAAMDQITAAEDWGDAPPAHQSILVGGLPGPERAPPPDATDTPARAAEAVARNARAFFDAGADMRWPRACGADGFDWSALRAPANATGEARLRAQYMRANIDPSMRYVQARTGTARHRMRTDRALYSNLYLAGDWTDNPGNLGGIEYAMISGLLASRAISGVPRAIPRVARDSPYLRMRPRWTRNADLPLFIEHNGMQTFPGPFQFRDVKAWAFFVRGDMAKMRALADRMFTHPSGGQMALTPVSDMMMLSIIEVTKAGAAFSPNVSAEAERELAVWMGLGRRAAPDSPEITRIHAFCPYLVVNNPLAVHVGQSIYGYAKQPGGVTLPGDAGADGAIEVTAWGVRDDPMKDEWGFKPLMRIRPLGDPSAPPEPFEGLEGLIAQVGAALASIDAGLDPTLGLAENMLADMARGRLDQVFVKQVRDIVNSERAVLQGITGAPVFFSGVKGVKLARPHALEIDDLYNTALCGTLGLPPRATLAFGLEFTMNFNLAAGRVLWSHDPQGADAQEETA